MEIWEKAKRIISKDWSLYDFGRPVAKPLNMTIEELEKGTQWAWKKFYSLESMLIKRFPLNDWQWMKNFQTSPQTALLRLLFYGGANRVFRKQIKRHLAFQESQS